MNAIALTPVGKHLPTSKTDVVFVHGLIGGGSTTWTNADQQFWPSWIAQDRPSANVWIADYPAPLLKNASTGGSFDLFDSAKALLDHGSNRGLGSRDLVWVAHSLGGLVTKQILRLSQDIRKYQQVWGRTRAIAFLATPHRGSGLANVAEALTGLSSSAALQSLAPGSALRELDTWFINTVDRSRTVVAYCEMAPLKIGPFKMPIVVVNQDSADPRIKDAPCVPVSADHRTIAKPRNRMDPVYIGVLGLVASGIEDQPSKRSGDPTVDTTRAGNVELVPAGSSRLQAGQTSDNILQFPGSSDRFAESRDLLGRISSIPMVSRERRGSRGAALTSLRPALQAYASDPRTSDRQSRLAERLDIAIRKLIQASPDTAQQERLLRECEIARDLLAAELGREQ